MLPHQGPILVIFFFSRLESKSNPNLGALLNRLSVDLSRNSEERLWTPFVLDQSVGHTSIVDTSLHCRQWVKSVLSPDGDGVLFGREVVVNLCPNHSVGQWVHSLVVGSIQFLSFVIP